MLTQRPSPEGAVIERALEVNQPDSREPLEVLAKVGGFEIGGLAGAILGAASRQVPVVIDGSHLRSSGLDSCRIMPSGEKLPDRRPCFSGAGTQDHVETLGLKPLLDLGLRLGEGTGAALGISLAETSARILGGMSTLRRSRGLGKRRPIVSNVSRVSISNV